MSILVSLSPIKALALTVQAEHKAGMSIEETQENHVEWLVIIVIMGELWHCMADEE